jgi:hypothetical protein
MGIDRRYLADETLQQVLKRKLPTIERLKDYYDRRLKIVEDLYSRQPEADHGLPKDLYARLLETAKSPNRLRAHKRSGQPIHQKKPG